MAAEKYVREVKGYKWDIISGVSIGALNGMMLAMEKYARLEELWKSMPKKVPYKKDVSLWQIMKILFGAKSIYSNKFVEDLINQNTNRTR